MALSEREPDWTLWIMQDESCGTFCSSRQTRKMFMSGITGETSGLPRERKPLLDTMRTIPCSRTKVARHVEPGIPPECGAGDMNPHSHLNPDLLAFLLGPTRSQS